MAEIMESTALAFQAVVILNEKLFMQEDDQKDVTLSGDGGLIRAHLFILSAASEVRWHFEKRDGEAYRNHTFPESQRGYS